MSNTVGAIPWYKSQVQISQVAALVSAAIALSPKLGTLIGVKTPADVEAWVTTVFGIFALAAPIIGTVFRAKSAIQPLTITQSAADAHPATVQAQSTVLLAPAPTAPMTQQINSPPAAAPVPGKPWGK